MRQKLRFAVEVLLTLTLIILVTVIASAAGLRRDPQGRIRIIEPRELRKKTQIPQASIITPQPQVLAAEVTPISTTPIDYTGASITVPHKLNDTGDVVGGAKVEGQWIGWHRTPGGTFNPVQFPGAIYTEALDINNSGQIVGWYMVSDNWDQTPPRGFILENGVYTTLNPPAENHWNFVEMMQAKAINNSGQIAGLFNEAEDRHGFIVTAGSWARIDFSLQRDINDLGQTVGFFYGPAGPGEEWARFSFKRVDGVYQQLVYEEHYELLPNGLNNLGAVVGLAYPNSGGQTNFLYDGTTFSTLVLPCEDHANQIYAQVDGINDQGTIVGTCGQSETGVVTMSFMASFAQAPAEPKPPKTKIKKVHKDKKNARNIEDEVRRSFGVK